MRDKTRQIRLLKEGFRAKQLGNSRKKSFPRKEVVLREIGDAIDDRSAFPLFQKPTSNIIVSLTPLI